MRLSEMNSSQKKLTVVYFLLMTAFLLPILFFSVLK